MYSRENKLAKKAENHTHSNAPSPLEPRSFGIQAKSEPAESTSVQEKVDTQSDRANPYSINLLNIPVHAPGKEPPAPPQIGVMQARMAEMLDKPTAISAPSATNSLLMQRQAAGEKEDEMILKKSEAQAESSTARQKPKENNTGMPDHLKAGIENLSGISMDDVKVHYNSEKPTEVGALAYAQGTDIHLGSGQEQHLPHEAWHVVQQKQGRVNPTMQRKGVEINDNEGLEREADVMGTKALGSTVLSAVDKNNVNAYPTSALQLKSAVIQLQPKPGVTGASKDSITLKNLVDALFKNAPSGGVAIGDGSALAACSHEVNGGNNVGGRDHQEKCRQVLNGVTKLIQRASNQQVKASGAQLSPDDLKIAVKLQTDLNDALAGNYKG